MGGRHQGLHIFLVFPSYLFPKTHSSIVTVYTLTYTLGISQGSRRFPPIFTGCEGRPRPASAGMTLTVGSAHAAAGQQVPSRAQSQLLSRDRKEGVLAASSHPLHSGLPEPQGHLPHTRTEAGGDGSLLLVCESLAVHPNEPANSQRTTQPSSSRGRTRSRSASWDGGLGSGSICDQHCLWLLPEPRKGKKQTGRWASTQKVSPQDRPLSLVTLCRGIQCRHKMAI